MRSMAQPIAGTTLAVFASLGLAHGQTADAPPAFEVASVKPSPLPPPGQYPRPLVRGGPGSSDPGMATFENFDLASLVTMAYDIPRYRLSAPDWLPTSKFEITAKIPPGTTRPQYRLMLQNLLAERFKLALHHETKEMPIYELVVAKNGPKLKESPEDPAAADAGLQPPSAGSSPPKGYSGPVNLAIPKCSIEHFIAILAGHLGQPVADATGLTGTYEIRLHYNLGLQTAAPSEAPGAEAADPQPTILDAVQQQLGLKLIKKNAPVDILVIDHLEKLPTRN